MNSHDTLDRAQNGRTTLRTKMDTAANALLLTGSLVDWTTARSDTDNLTAAPDHPIAATAGTATRTIGEDGDSYAPIVKQTTPAVVTIRSERTVKTVSQELPNDPIFQEFFDQRFGNRAPRQTPPQHENDLGSDMIIRANDYILTNHHVVNDADHMSVELTNGRTFKTKIIGSDAPSDLAVVKIEGSNLKTLALGNSNNVRTDNVVLAIGNPLGIDQTVTMGIVSAKRRTTERTGDGNFENFIQTDAPINQGNSNNALINTRDELIGINSQILSPSSDSIGIGFTIPANMTNNVMSQLINKKQIRRGLLNVTIQPMTSNIARSLELTEIREALISDVQAASPTEQKNIRRDDIITAMNKTPMTDNNILRNHIAQLLPNTKTQINVLRDGKEKTISITLTELKTTTRNDKDAPKTSADESNYEMTVEPLTRNATQQLGVTATNKIVVQTIQPSGRATKTDIQTDDMIKQVNNKNVQSDKTLRTALKTENRPALLLIHRDPATVFVPLDRSQNR